MEKIQERIKQQLQKQDAWDDWDSWEDWGKEMEGSIKLLSTGVDTLLSAFDSFNQNQADLKNVIDSLNKKMEKQPTPKSDGTKLHCAIEKMQKQVDGMNIKLHNGLRESKQHKEQLEELDKKLINEQQASLKLNSALDKMGERLAEVEKNLNLLQAERQPKKLEMPSIISGVPLQPVPEWVLRERKRNNIIIFGLREVDDDQALIKSLLNDLDIPFDALSDMRGHFRVGRLNSERPRPIVIKLAHANKKQEILMNARNLKGMESWIGVTIAHDLTKMEYQEERIQESEKVKEMNQNLSVEETRPDTRLPKSRAGGQGPCGWAGAVF